MDGGRAGSSEADEIELQGASQASQAHGVDDMIGRNLSAMAAPSPVDLMSYQAPTGGTSPLVTMSPAAPIFGHDDTEAERLPKAAPHYSDPPR